MTTTKRAAKRKEPKKRTATAKPLEPGTKRAKAAEAFVKQTQGNKTRALKKAGYSKAVAEHHQKRVFGDPAVQAEVLRLLVEKGLTDDVVIDRHRTLIDALVTKWYQDQSLGDHTDNQTRLGAVELYYKLRGLLTQKVEVEVVVRQWTEHVLHVIQKYVPAEQRAACIAEAVRILSTPGAN